MTDMRRVNGIVSNSEAFATGIGVALMVEWQDEQERLTFAVTRGEAPPGAGERAIRHLLGLVDAAGIEVAIDVAQSTPALIRYYWRFGFRAFSDDATAERRELERMEREHAALIASGRSAEDIGVTFMWRDTPPPRVALAA